jgi:hypothetical protein
MIADENRPAGRASRFGIPRWLIVTVGALVFVVVGGGVALKALFPPEKLRALVVPQIEERVGREVQLASVKLQVFPRIAVRLDEFAIANSPGFSADPALQVEALQLQVRLMPLLRKQLELGQVRLVRPVVRYEVLADGSHNFEGLGPAGEEARAPRGAAPVVLAAAFVGLQEAAGPAAAPGLVISDLTLTDGTVLYSDERTGRSARMALQARVSVDRSSDGRALDSRGRVDLTSIRALLTGIGQDSVAIPDLGIDYDLLADLPGDSLIVRDLQVEFGEIPLGGSGSIRELRARRIVDFAIESGDVDVESVLAGLPEAARAKAGDIDASGIARFSLTASGSMAEGSQPRVNGAIEVHDFNAAYGEYGEALSNASGQITFDATSLSMPSLEGQLMGRPFQLQLDVNDFETFEAEGRFNGAFDLALLAEMQDDALPMAGTAAVDLNFSGPVNQPAQLSLTGPIDLSDFRYQVESLAVPVEISSGTIRLTGDGLVTEELPIQLGSSDLTLSLDAPGALPYALSKGAIGSAPTIRFTLTSQRLDMSELAVEPDSGVVGYGELVSARLAGRQLDGRDPGAIARERTLLPPIPPVNSNGRVRIAEFLNPPTEARDISFDVVVRNGVAELRNFQGRVYGGNVTGTLSLDFSDMRPPFTLRYDLKLREAEAATVLTRWTRLGSALSGLVDFDIAGSATLDETGLPAPDALDAAGRADFRNGRFQDFGLARALVDQFKLDPSALSGFRAFGGAYEIKNGAFLVQGWQFDGTDLAAVITGAAGLGGSLNLKLDLKVPPATLQKMGLMQGGGVGGLINQLTGDSDEPFDVAVGVGGTMSNPTLQLDMEALQQEIARRLGGDDLLRRLFKPPPDGRRR